MSRKALLAAAAVAGISLSGSAYTCDETVDVLGPDAVVRGKTVRDWCHENFRWGMETPRAENPILNPDADCKASQPGEVFCLPVRVVLAGAGPVYSEIGCTVPYGVPVSLFYGTFCFSGQDFSCSASQAFTTRVVDATTTFDFEVDGETLNLLEHRVGVSECFRLQLPAENAEVFGRGPGENFVAVDGYGVILDSLCPGSHVMRMNWLGGEGIRLEILYEIEVEAPSFVRGDSNDDGDVDLSDAQRILNWLFLGGEEPGCIASANANGDERADISDAVYLLRHLFLGDAAPDAPFPDCGPMPEGEVLTCDVPPAGCR